MNARGTRRRLIRASLLATAALVAASSVSCGGGSFPRETTAANTRTDDPWLDGPRCTSEGAAGLDVAVVEPGPGPVVLEGQTVRVHYTAQLPDGTTVHDTRAGGAPIEVIIGSTHVICGFERALAGMRAGERRRAVVAPWLAFGDAGRGSEVPGGTALTFVIDLYLPAEVSHETRGGPVRPPASRGGGSGGRGGGR